MWRMFVGITLAAAGMSGCAGGGGSMDLARLRQEVLETERSFAATMAARDHGAFVAHLAPDTIFFSGEDPIRGSAAVAEAWRPFFDGAGAPFSWEPDGVEVLETGSLALSTGPVYDPAGRVTGRFNSIWRRDPSGEWKVVFDKGSPVCDCAPR